MPVLGTDEGAVNTPSNGLPNGSASPLPAMPASPPTQGDNLQEHLRNVSYVERYFRKLQKLLENTALIFEIFGKGADNKKPPTLKAAGLSLWFRSAVVKSTVPASAGAVNGSVDDRRTSFQKENVLTWHHPQVRVSDLGGRQTPNRQVPHGAVAGYYTDVSARGRRQNLARGRRALSTLPA